MKTCVVYAARDVRIDHRDAVYAGAGEVVVGFAWGGICGSDIHYFEHGRVGDSIIRSPMVLGHEFSGTVVETGAGVTNLRPGDKVAVNPAHPCDHCEYCRDGRSNLCTDMRFLGSASRWPHQNGGFSERSVVAASQCTKVPADTDLRHLALAEPYAVALHAVAIAGDLSGQRVLITGAGVIGQMLALAARRAGAAEIIMADVVQEALKRAQLFGADCVVNSANPTETATLMRKPICDTAFDASGAAPAVDMCLEALRPNGTLLQVGFLPPIAPLTMAKLLNRELRILGTYRFVDEFDEAVRQIVEREVDLTGMISADLTLDNPKAVFAAAQDRVENLKVMVHF